jgi:hypothetical protein
MAVIQLITRTTKNKHYTNQQSVSDGVQEPINQGVPY